jgi:hypothetical protein
MSDIIPAVTTRKEIFTSLAILAASFPAVAEPPARPCAGRPDFGAAIDAVVADIAAKSPALSHIVPPEILFVAADARHSSRATTRPTAYDGGSAVGGDGVHLRPSVKFKGRRIKYVVELRPKFFRTSTAEQRLATIFHELLHMSPAFDGSIPAEKSHKGSESGEFESAVREAVQAYIGKADPAVLRPLGWNGEVLMRMWLDRPKVRVRMDDKKSRRAYGEGDLFNGPVEMITAAVRR